VADREFIWGEWLGFLSDREVPFVIRIQSSRKGALSGSGEAALPARMFFRKPLLPAEGQKRHQKKPLKTKNHGWPERSLFRYGLDLLRSIMLNLVEKKEQFRRCARLLINP